MTSTGKLMTKAIAFVVIVAILNAVGLSPVVMVFVTGIVFVIWLVTRRAQMREVERIFEFYVAADAILREEERRWYGFEIAEVIEHGESLLEMMPDPPPLNYFALGALYRRLGNHEAGVQYLSRLTEDVLYDETHRIAPSPQLRRYVMVLRRLELHPAAEPQTLAAIRNLERVRQRNATKMLLDSRGMLANNAAVAPATKTAAHESREPREETYSDSAPLSSISAPPPISAVLRDIYQEETSTH
jgi:Holliday junction resolvasome RuvABC DNA-binding subunit